jgi:hypothetical protein
LQSMIRIALLMQQVSDLGIIERLHTSHTYKNSKLQIR